MLFLSVAYKYNEGSKGILERCGIFVYTLSAHYSSLRSLKRPTPYSRYSHGIWTVARVGSLRYRYAVRAAAVSGGHPRSDEPPHPIKTAIKLLHLDWQELHTTS